MMAEKVQPMSAARGLDESTAHRLGYPQLASVKLDGIRGIVQRDSKGKPIVLSKSFKPIRSRFVQETFAREEFMDIDGEFIFGDPTDPLVCNKTYSAVMTVGSNTPVDFYAFDRFAHGGAHFVDRFKSLEISRAHSGCEFLKVVPQIMLYSWDEIIEMEQRVLAQGYEGLILRKPDGLYKFGRSTLIEQHLVKLKRVKTSEAWVIDFTELMRNNNAPVIDALGYQKRSASKEGKTSGGMMGTLIVRDFFTGIEFEIGTGFSESERIHIWEHQEDYIGKLLTYKHFPIGQVRKPRQPAFKCWRDPSDMLEA